MFSTPGMQVAQMLQHPWYVGGIIVAAPLFEGAEVVGRSILSANAWPVSATICLPPANGSEDGWFQKRHGLPVYWLFRAEGKNALQNV
jgi:hypothetical protein